MQEEARIRAQEERAQREVEAAQRARLAREAYEAEQARLAQQEYERQLAEYAQKQAQYERDLAEYERQKAEYEAEMARLAAEREDEPEAKSEVEPEMETGSVSRRRRGAPKRYSDYIDGEHVDALPDAPQWPQMTQKNEEKAAKHHKLLDQMARMIEPEEEQLSSIHKLPPRVNMQEAYKPAAAPRKPGRRTRNT